MQIGPGIELTYKPVLAYMAETDKVIVGLHRPRLLLMAALAARGHILAKAKPGKAKSLLMKTSARVIGGVKTGRLQMTADLKPSAITGYTVETATGRAFRPSPLQGLNLVLVDEFDNANPQTQRAFLEAMAEAQYTVDGVTTRMEEIFQVMAVINGTESEGTFPISNATSDRFMFFIDWQKLSLQELEAVNASENLERDHPESVIEPVLSLNDLMQMRRETSAMRGNCSPAIRRYIAALAASIDPDYDEFHRVVRKNGESFAGLIGWGGADRLNQSLLRASAAIAVFTGSSCIEPHHVRFIFPDAARPHFKMSARAGYGKEQETQGSFIERVLATVRET
jgi:MoxR-like ATPase